MGRVKTASEERIVARDLGNLPPYRSPMTMVAVLTLGVAVLALGYLMLVGMTVLSITVSILLAVLAIGLFVLANRDTLRRIDLDNAIENIGPDLGARRLSRGLIRASRWQGGWVGFPGKLVIRYAKAINGRDLNWTASIIAGLASSFETFYKVSKHDHRAKVLTLVHAPESAAAAEEIIRSEAFQHADLVVKELLGETAQVEVSEDAEGAIVEVEVAHHAGNAMAISARRNKVEKIISARLSNGRWGADWDVPGSKVRFFRKKELTFPLFAAFDPVSAASRRELYENLSVPLGEAEGELIVWNPYKQAHLLISGGTGSGKTVLEFGVVLYLAYLGMRIWIIDGKRVEFIGFRGHPNVEVIAAKVEHTVRLIIAAHELMEERYSAVEEERANLFDFEPLFLVIDEQATLVTRIARWWKTIKPKGAPAVCPVIELIEDIARLGRTAGVHLILGLQRPDVKFVGGEMRDNFGARVSVGRLGPQGANMMWDSFAIGVSIPPIKGRGIAVNKEGRAVEFQSYWSPKPKDPNQPDEVLAVLERANPPECRYGRKVVETLETTYNLDTGEPEPATYEDYANARLIDVDQVAGTVLTKPETATRKNITIIKEDLEDSEVIEVQEYFEEADFSGYSDEEDVSVQDLQVGDLIQIDEALDLWAVLEGLDEDYSNEENNYLLDVRDYETGEVDSLSIPEDHVFSSRRPEQER